MGNSHVGLFYKTPWQYLVRKEGLIKPEEKNILVSLDIYDRYTRCWVTYWYNVAILLIAIIGSFNNNIDHSITTLVKLRWPTRKACKIICSCTKDSTTSGAL